MQDMLRSLLIAVLLCGAVECGTVECGTVVADDRQPDSLDTAAVRFEQNATDGDVEVVFEVKGGDEGLTALTVIAPDDRIVASFRAPDATTLGIRQFIFESPEPTDVARLKLAYPEGIYRFRAVTSGGQRLHGESPLSHDLPRVATLTYPEPDSDDVAVAGATIVWSVTEKTAAVIVEVEQDDLGVNATVRLPPAATTHSLPDGFLRPSTEYQLSIGIVAENGNISFVETTFTTAAQ